ncbi:MAG: hypothetical protein ACYC9D_01780 [Candidatus Dormibacteria bacterium]
MSVTFSGVNGRAADAGAPLIDRAVAVRTGAAFAAAHFSAFSSLQERETKLLDHGDFSAYWIHWQRQVGQAWLLDEVWVTVNAENGRVSSYSSRNVPTTVTTIPSIDSVRALASAGEAATNAYGPGAALGAPDLELVYDNGGQQRLVWIVAADAAPAPGVHLAQGGQIWVDAQTGTASVTHSKA